MENVAPNSPTRKPSDKLQCAALSGAVLLRTPDGNSIAITPGVAMELSKQLGSLATIAGGLTLPEPDPVIQ